MNDRLAADKASHPLCFEQKLSDYSPNRFLLFTPGPVNIANNVRKAITKADIGHREVEFEDLLHSIESKLLKLFEITNTADYSAVVISGSGTAANESMLSSVVGDQNILILTNGAFGERLYNISIMHNKNTFLLDFGWGNTFDPLAIDTYIKENSIDTVAMVHHETCSGMLNSLEGIGALTKANGTKLIVDCVSSAGAEKIDMEKHNISFCSSTSSKAIGSHCGLSFVVGKKTEFEKLKGIPAKSTYLNLYKFYRIMNTASQTPNTPAVHLFYSFEQALQNILDAGVSNYRTQIKSKATLLRKGMKKLDLDFLIDQKYMSSVLTTVYIPSHIDVGEFRQKLRKKSILVYEGKGPYKNKVFQVGNIGELTAEDVLYFLRSLKEVFESFATVS